MTRQTFGFALWALSATLAVVWFVEAFTEGRGFVSTYLAPFAIIGNLVGAAMWKRHRSSQSGSAPRTEG